MSVGIIDQIKGPIYKEKAPEKEPKPVFATIKPVIANERNKQSGAVQIDRQYEIRARQTIASKLMQDIKFTKAKKVVFEEPNFSYSFTPRQTSYLKKHCKRLGVEVEETRNQNSMFLSAY